MQRYTVYFIRKLLYLFRVVPSPIIRIANNCIYSIWYLSHRYCYLQLSWKSWNWFECAVGGVQTYREDKTYRENQNTHFIYLFIYLTLIGPCIVIYFCSKANEMHQFFKFILYCTRTLHVSDGHSVHHQTVHTASGICQTDSVDCLLAGTSWNSFPLASSQQNLSDVCLMLYVQS